MERENKYNLRKILIELKLYVGRSNGYINLLNSGMILFLTLSRLKEFNYITFSIDKFIIPIFLCAVFVLVLFGWFEVRILRGLPTEYNRQMEYTPHFMEMKNMVKEIRDNQSKKVKEWVIYQQMFY